MRPRLRTITSLLLSVFALLLFANAAAAQFAPSERPKWFASWISHPTAPLREPGVFHFRKIFSLDAQPTQFRVLVSADNRFQLFVNGQRVGEGPARGDLLHWRYETFDLAHFLHSGKNIIAATVWQFGIWAPLAQVTDRMAFLVEGDTPAESVVNTDTHWEVEEEKGHTTKRPMPPGMWNYYVAGPGERLDAAHYDWRWNQLDSSSADWVSAAQALREIIYPQASIPYPPRTEPSHTRWTLYPDALPPMEYKELAPSRVVRTSSHAFQEFPQHAVTVPANSEATLLLDQGVMVTAYPQLIVNGGKGALVQLVYAEALYDQQQKRAKRDEVADRVAIGVTDEFLPDGGSLRSFQPLWWRTFRYLELRIKTAADPLQLQTLHSFFSAYPFEDRGSFTSSDPELARIREICWRTSRVDAHETFMDSAYWEQLQYFGDTRVQALISYSVSGDGRLGRQALEASRDSMLPEGITQSRYPSSLVQVIPTFSLTYINMIHDYWMYQRDPQFVASLLPSTREVLAWFSRYCRDDEFLARLPYWNVADQGEVPQLEKEERSTLYTIEWIAALRDAAEMEQQLGDKNLAAAYSRQAQASAQSVYRLCWSAKFGLLADSPIQDHFSQHSNAWGVLYDVIPQPDQAAVMRKILSREAPDKSNLPELSRMTPYYQFYLAAAIDHANLGDLYLDTLHPWRDMLALGFSTTPETPEPTRSDTHAWSAHPAFYFNTILAGVHPSAPDFSSVRIQPSLGKLDWLESATPHPAGIIRVSLHRSAASLDAAIDLPPNTSGVFVWHGREYPLHPGSQHLTAP